MECANWYKNEEYIYKLVDASIFLQLGLYATARLRKQIRSKFLLGCISVIFSLANWIPTCNLIIICSFAVVSHDYCNLNDGRATTPLLNWASLMLLHVVSLCPERETPYSLHLGVIAKESCSIMLEFLFQLMIFLTASIFLFKSQEDETKLSTVVLVLLACTRTFGKLKGLHDTSNMLKQGNLFSFGEENDVTCARFKLLNPVGACLKASDKFYLTYCRFYEVVPSLIQPLIITALLTTISEELAVSISCIYLSPCAHQCLKILGKKIDSCFLRTAMSALPSNVSVFLILACQILFMSLNASSMSVTIIVTTHFLLVFPAIEKYCFPHVYPRAENNGPPSWSETIPQFNLLEYGLLLKPSKLITTTNYMLNTWALSGIEQYKYEIGEFIFTELKTILLKLSNDGHSSLNEARDTIIAEKGLWVLKQENHPDLIDCKATFNERVIKWHVATHILFHTQDNNGISLNRYLGMVLSDYMGYLLIVQPWIMSKQRGAVLKVCVEMWAHVSEFTKNCAEAPHYSTHGKWSARRVVEEILTKAKASETKLKADFELNRLKINVKYDSEIKKKQRLKITEGASETEVGVSETKVERHTLNTILQGALDLAETLESRYKDENQRWNIILKVWVEMLTYAAIRCNPMDHIQGLSQGGELATIIWFWMHD